MTLPPDAAGLLRLVILLAFALLLGGLDAIIRAKRVRR